MRLLDKCPIDAVWEESQLCGFTMGFQIYDSESMHCLDIGLWSREVQCDMNLVPNSEFPDAPQEVRKAAGKCGLYISSV